MTSNSGTQAFFSAVDSASKKRRQSILTQLQHYKEHQLKAARELAREKYDEYMKEALTGLDNECSARSQRVSLELRRNVTQERERITERVFAEVERRLKAFTESEKYKSMLIKSAGEMAKICAGSSLTLYLRQEDMRYADELGALGKGVTVSTADDISLGGVYGVCEEKRLRLDDTLEARLLAAREHFLETSGLSI